MKRLLLLVAACFALFQTGNVFAQGQTCATANVFCTGTNYYFPNTTTNPNGIGQIACLFSTPNPVWYYMQISQPGIIGISLEQTSTNGTPIDVDFAIWGPFTSLADACSNYANMPTVDCSYSASASEHIDIPGNITASGQFYLLMMTNFSQQAGFITFSSDPTSVGTTAGTGQVSISSNLPVCPGDSVVLIGAGGAAGNYSWTTPANQVIIADTLIIPSLQPADYGNYMVVSGNGVCANMAIVSVMGAQAPVATANSPVCNGGTIFLQADTGFVSYSWTGPNGFTSTVQNPVIPNADTSKAGLYTVYGQLNGCQSLPGTVQVAVDTSGMLQVSAANTGPVSQGSTLFLSASGSNGTYSWTGPNGFTATGANAYIQNMSPANAGTYTVSVAAAGCTSDTAQTNVLVNPLNQISGTVYSDDNNNGTQDTGESPLPWKVVTLQPGWHTTITDSQGAYTAFVPDSTYTVNVSGLTTYQTPNPASHSVTVTGSSQVVTGKDFGIYSPPVTDLKVTIAELVPPVPGMNSLHRISYKNVGNLPITGTVRYLPDPLFQLGSNTTGYTTAGDTLIWSFTNLLPTHMGNIYVDQLVPVGTPLGTTLSSSAFGTPLAGDADSLNNAFTLPQVVVGSWDPNDKAVIPAGPITPQQVAAGQDLVYTIRFQNTGTYLAFNILVADTLSSLLDWSSFEMLSSSHSHNLTLRDNGILEWHFPSIMLPDSNSNEPESHGYIQYRIKPKNNLVAGDVIENTAHIFFDFNEAVVTNTVQTPVGIVGTEELAVNKTLNIFPNPNTGNFTLQLSNAGRGPVQVRVLNLLGQTVLEESTVSAAGVFEHHVKLSHAPQGIYLLQVQQGDHRFTTRVVLQR